MRRTIIAAATLLCLVGAARAADFDAKITNVDGTPLADEKGKEVTLTVRTVCLNALMAPLSQADQQKPDSGKMKVERDDLAKHVLGDDGYEFKSEDIALLKKLVNEFYPSPLVVAQAWAALERPAPAREKKQDKK
jgi:hypothetical protein